MFSKEIQVEPLEPIREDWFQHFIKRRSLLIESYELGEIDKKEFLLKNIEDLHRSNLKPFFQIDRMEKAIYNYQYYNAMAKHHLILAKKIKYIKKKNRQYCYFLSLADKYYNLKDQTILYTLEFAGFKNIEAYFIRCNSKDLDEKLFEIVFKNEKQVIFHSKSDYLLKLLKEKEIFIEDIRSSVIESYINDRY